MPKPAPKTFDPATFAAQAERDLLIRNLLIGGAVVAGFLAFIYPGTQVVWAVIAPTVMLGMWFWLSTSTARVARSLASLAEFAGQEPDRAEALLRDAISVRLVMRWARMLTYHRLAGIYYVQRRFDESRAVCLCLLNQPLKGPAAAVRPHLLLMLAEAQLELDDLPGAYHALAHLQQTRLGLTESLQRLAIQTRYEVAVGAYEAALHRSRAKVELAELMPAAHCATMHAMLATAAHHQGQTKLADWLWERTRLLSPVKLLEQFENGGFGIAVVEHDGPSI